MITRKLLNLAVSTITIASLLIGSTNLVNAAQKNQTLPAPGPGRCRTPCRPDGRETKVPHYFGPYPNWANSPQVLADAIVTIGLGTPTPVSIGNPLIERGVATDYATGPGVLAPVFVVIPSAVLPDGMLQNFQIWNQTAVGSGPNPSAGNLFHAYVLRPTGTANQYTVVYDSGELTVPVPTDPGGEVTTFSITPTTVIAGDVIGFYGQGIPVDVGGGTDILSYPAPAAPVSRAPV